MMRNIGKRLTLLLLLFVCGVFAENSDSSYPPKGARGNRLEFKHLEWEGIGFNEGYSSVDLFLSNPDPFYDCLYAFFDGRAHIFNSGRAAFNGGIGCRYMLGSLSDVFGLNAYYDYRKSKRKSWNQVGAGLEYLRRNWEFRINGYLPIGPRLTSPYDLQFSHFTGHSVVVSRRYEYSMYGGDYEMGCHFKRWKNFDFYVGAGTYAFKGKIGKPAIGGKLRFKGRFGEYVSLEAADSYDKVFQNRFHAEIAITIPFGPRSKPNPKGKVSCCKQNILSQRVHDAPYRNEIIVLNDKSKSSIAIDPGTGLPYFFWFVDNTSSSLGTYESPYATLAAAQSSAREGEIIYVFPGDETTTGMDAGITLQNRQQFLGSGVEQELETTFGSITIPAQTTVSPNITLQSASLSARDPVVRIANNNVVSGFVIQCNVITDGATVYPDGIGSDGVATENLVAKNNVIISGVNATTIHAIDLTNAVGTIVIKNNVINVFDSSGGASLNVGISVTNTNQSNATFEIQNNSAYGLNFYNATFTSCSNMNTIFDGNDIFADSAGNIIGMTVSGTAAVPSYLTFKNNRCVGQGNGLSLTFGSSSSHNVNMEVAIQNNYIASASAAVALSCDGLGTINSNITNNYLNATGDNTITLSGASTVNLNNTILSNTLIPSKLSTGIALTQSSSGAVTAFISQNEIFGGINGFSSTFANADPLTGGTQTLTIDNNSFYNQAAYGILGAIGDSGGSGTNPVTSVQIVTNNRFFGPGSRAISDTTTQGGTICLTLTDNFCDAPKIYSNLDSAYVGAYHLVDDSGVLFRLQPVFNNIGEIDTSGLILNVSLGTCQ